MGKKGIKQYARIASKYGTKFEGYNVPVGAIYGRVLIPYEKGTEYIFFICTQPKNIRSFRPLSGSYISQYHPRNPMSCLGRIGGLRGKSNFIEMQPFWKVKNSHKSSI